MALQSRVQAVLLPAQSTSMSVGGCQDLIFFLFSSLHAVQFVRIHVIWNKRANDTKCATWKLYQMRCWESGGCSRAELNFGWERVEIVVILPLFWVFYGHILQKFHMFFTFLLVFYINWGNFPSFTYIRCAPFQLRVPFTRCHSSPGCNCSHIFVASFHCVYIWTNACDMVSHYYSWNFL